MWLWLFAVIAQNFAPLSRWAFRRWHGAAPLILAAPQEAEDGIAVFQYRGRYWKLDELVHLVHDSPARYLLFQMTKQGGSVSDLLPLFASERTFAVGRQVDYRDWKAWIFTMAAFRRLTKGEAAQTLAPVSDFLLVDRRKLAALGVHKTIVPGTAWLLMFWKAAAAGCRCYSVHGPGEIGPAPDWPYEEAEFVTRTLADPALRALGPAEPDLSRGNITFAIGRNREPSGRKTVLVVSPYVPYTRSLTAATVRIYNLCRALAPRVDFALACFREEERHGKLRSAARDLPGSLHARS